MEAEDKLLASLIKTYPCLYNNSILGKEKRNKLLSIVAEAMTLKLARKITADEVYDQWRKLRSDYGKLEVKMASGKVLSKTQKILYQNLSFLNKYIKHKKKLSDLTKVYADNKEKCKDLLSSDNGIKVQEFISVDSQDVKPNILEIEMVEREEIILSSDDEINDDPIYQDSNLFNNDKKMCKEVINDSQDSIASAQQNKQLLTAINNRVKGKSSINSVKGKSIIREKTTNLPKTSLQKPNVSNAISNLNAVVLNLKQNQMTLQYAFNQHLLSLKENRVMKLLQVLEIIEGFKTK